MGSDTVGIERVTRMPGHRDGGFISPARGVRVRYALFYRRSQNQNLVADQSGSSGLSRICSTWREISSHPTSTIALRTPSRGFLRQKRPEGVTKFFSPRRVEI